MEILGKLFGSVARVKIMRLFLLNPEAVFEVRDVRVKSKVEAHIVRRELARLNSIGFIKRKSVLLETHKKRGKKVVLQKKWIRGLGLDEQFPYLDVLRVLLTASRTIDRRAIITRFRGAGAVKLLVITGIFIPEERSRIDVLIVGDALKRKQIVSALQTIESEVGKELRYAVLKTDDFLYRAGIYDKFVRDVFDYRHEKLIDRLGVSPFLPR